ncbi:MAG TPA: potassium-transporting ATPase subunit KdpA [Bryobacteraceae bacterium]|nr:potassium-transporting ATPase subunit KdpA [Bryobacteraceae bacterium]
MSSNGIAQFLFFFAVIAVLTKPLGIYMARLFQGERTFLHPILQPIERFCYRFTGVNEQEEQTWRTYTGSVLSFSLFGFLFVYALGRLQGFLPWNPAGMGTATAPAGATAMTPDLAFNTAVSFVTNTNWQAYSGETTVSYLVQMAALTVQNFASAAAGVAIAVAVIRGFTRQQSETLGNFWVDVTRATLYLLLPLALVSALFLCSQGVIQNLGTYTQAVTVEGRTQIIAQGPVASQEAIKMLGTNGGGFFNANSAHPLENPTPLTNFLQIVLIFLIPSGLTVTFGQMAGDTRQGWALFGAMAVLFVAGAFFLYGAEQAGNPNVAQLNVATSATATQSGGNMEGKETRFGIASTSLFAAVTTAASCGAVNGMHDSLTPLGGLVPIFFIEIGEVVFGGVGSGLYGMLLYAILAVFIAGLMVGRTPEYLGKKIESREVKMAMMALIVTSAAILVFAGVSSIASFAKDGYWNGGFGAATANLNNSGPHGFSEILYAYASGTGNNGSAFAGLSANTPWYNLSLGLSMLLGRFLIIIPMLAAAGSLAAKKRAPATSGTFPTHGALFAGLLVGTILILGALTFFPALSLSPIVEHFLMQEGRLF